SPTAAVSADLVLRLISATTLRNIKPESSGSHLRPPRVEEIEHNRVRRLTLYRGSQHPQLISEDEQRRARPDVVKLSRTRRLAVSIRSEINQSVIQERQRAFYRDNGHHSPKGR